MMAFHHVSRQKDPDVSEDYLYFKVKHGIDNHESPLRQGVLITNKDPAVTGGAHQQIDDFKDYSNISVYDLISLEDIPLVDFILKSPSNIVLKSREQYYGFDRTVLVDYMDGKRVFINDWFGYILETPFRQYLSDVDMRLVCEDRFRIFELYDETSVPFRDGAVSIYNVRPFGVVQCLDAMLIL
jgi:hypothetical protein